MRNDPSVRYRTWRWSQKLWSTHATDLGRATGSTRKKSRNFLVPEGRQHMYYVLSLCCHSNKFIFSQLTRGACPISNRRIISHLIPLIKSWKSVEISTVKLILTFLRNYLLVSLCLFIESTISETAVQDITKFCNQSYIQTSTTTG